MRAYLAAFDAWLRDQSEERAAARSKALAAMRGSRRGKPLSPREREVLALRAGGMSRSHIARKLDLSPKTIAHHLEHVAEKLGTSDPFRLAAWAIRSGLVEP